MAEVFLHVQAHWCYTPPTEGYSQDTMHGRQSKQEGLFKELKRFAEQVGFEVRCEKLLREVGYRVRSGACSVNGRKWIILDRNLVAKDRIDLLADEIREFIPDTADIPLNLQKYLVVRDARGRKSEIRDQDAPTADVGQPPPDL